MLSRHLLCEGSNRLVIEWRLSSYQRAIRPRERRPSGLRKARKGDRTKRGQKAGAGQALSLHLAGSLAATLPINPRIGVNAPDITIAAPAAFEDVRVKAGNKLAVGRARDPGGGRRVIRAQFSNETAVAELAARLLDESNHSLTALRAQPLGRYVVVCPRSQEMFS